LTLPHIGMPENGVYTPNAITGQMTEIYLGEFRVPQVA